MLEGSGYLDHPNFRTAGHHDSAARLADYDHDGVAAGVIFHGSMNLEPIPFVASALGKPKPTGDLELVGVGQSIYNRWLADFVAASARTDTSGWRTSRCGTSTPRSPRCEWAHGAGLRGVNFPAMRDGELPPYNRRTWEPLWAVCEDLGMPLVTHVGGGHQRPVLRAGISGAPAAGVGDVLAPRGLVADLRRRVRTAPRTEARHHRDPGNWFPPTATELDTLHAFYDSKRDEPLNQALLDQVPRRPSEYMANNVFFGASFASPYEVEQAMLHGLGSQLLWGSDYPAPRGHLRLLRRTRGVPSVTRLALRNTFCDVPAAETERMVGGNAIEVYNLDASALRDIAREIDAPTQDEFATPIDAVPEAGSVTAFRSGAGGWS